MMTIEYANGEKIEVESMTEAEEIIEAAYPDAVYAEQWDSRGWKGDVELERLLVWENEEIAGEPGTGDDGSHAIAEIVREAA